MAVHDRRYKPYSGPITPFAGRFLVLPRYAFKDVFKSKLLVFFLGLTVLVPLWFAFTIYVRSNLDLLDALRTFQIDLGGRFVIGEDFFYWLFWVQSVFAFFLTLFIGPGLVSRDLANNGLPLYLSRPISRFDYVVGKLTILWTLLSVITWVAGLMLIVLNASLTRWGWLFENLHIAVAFVVASWLWIGLLGLLALALSAWVRWKVIAGFMMLVFFVGGLFFSFLARELFRSDWGEIADAHQLVRILMAKILGIAPPPGPPLVACIVALAALAALCLLLLNRRIRAYQVVT